MKEEAERILREAQKEVEFKKKFAVKELEQIENNKKNELGKADVIYQQKKTSIEANYKWKLDFQKKDLANDQVKLQMKIKELEGLKAGELRKIDEELIKTKSSIENRYKNIKQQFEITLDKQIYQIENDAKKRASKLWKI